MRGEVNILQYFVQHLKVNADFWSDPAHVAMLAGQLHAVMWLRDNIPNARSDAVAKVKSTPPLGKIEPRKPKGQR